MEKLFRIAALLYFFGGILVGWIGMFGAVLGAQGIADLLTKSSQQSILSAIAAAAISLTYRKQTLPPQPGGRRR